MKANSSSTRQSLIVLLLPLLVAVVFWPATRNDFVNYDDPRYVLGNAHVQSGLTWENVRWAFTTGYAANWHPLTWLSHMVDCRLFSLGPHGHHLTSVVLHAFNTLLAYLALRALTGSTWRSLCVALLFGLHPLRVESVAWVSERKDVLSTLFWMLTLWAYAEWGKRSLAQEAGRAWFYALSLLCLALGLMSKPMLVTVPFVLLLLDYWPLGRLRVSGGSNAVRLMVEKLPFFALAAAACVVTYVVQRQAGAVKGEEVFPLSIRIGNAAVSYLQYLVQFIHPTRLAVYYPHPGTSLSSGAVLLSVIVLLSITGIAVWQWRGRPWLAVGWFWYLGTLVPAIGLIQVGTQAMADRYTYAPLLGVMIALVWTLHELLMRWRIPAPVIATGATACFVACAMQTRAQIGYWQSSETLFRHALAVTGKNAVAHMNLGIALKSREANTEAINELEEALKLTPDSATAHLNLGIVLDSVGRSAEAVPHLVRATELEPKFAEGYFCLATVLFRQRRGAEAIAAYEQTVRLNPDHAEAHLQLGNIYYALNRYEEAFKEIHELLRLRPKSADAQNCMGSVLFAQGRLDDAVPYYETALRLQPDHLDARRNFDALRAAKAAQRR